MHGHDYDDETVDHLRLDAALFRGLVNTPPPAGQVTQERKQIVVSELSGAGLAHVKTVDHWLEDKSGLFLVLFRK